MSKLVKSKNLIKVLALAVILCFSMTTAVFADSDTDASTAPPGSGSPYAESVKENPSTEITGKHIIEGGSIKSGTFTFILTALDKTNPMPEGSVNGVKKVTISPGNEFTFGKITFPKQGNYKYKISRELIKSDELKQDDSVYEAEIQVFATSEVVMVLKKNGSEGKPDKIEYKDKYTPKKITEKEKEKKRAPQTGDEAMVLIVCTLAMFISFGVLKGARRRKEK